MLRLAKKTDQELVKKIHKECKDEIGSFNLYQIWDNYLAGKANFKYLIWDDVAFVRFGKSRKYKMNTIYDIGVLQSQRGKGIGKKIIMALPKPIILKCNCDNDGGNAFYKKIGMRQVGKVQSKNKKHWMNLWRI